MKENKIIPEHKKDKNGKSSLFDVIKFIAGLLFLLVVSYKLIISNWTFDFSKFDFSALLALILSLFAISLSIAFYFKATDTSNLFYDNTYKFTKEISEILGRIEAGFGERLRHLDEGYIGLVNKFDNPKEQNIQDTKEEIEKEKIKLKQDVEERNQILNTLLEKAEIEQEEKEKIRKQLKDKEIEISRQNRELNFLRNRLQHETENEDIAINELPDNLLKLLIDYVGRNNLSIEIFKKYPMSVLTRKYKLNMEELNKSELIGMLNMRIIHEDGTFTIHGIKILRELIKKFQ